MGSYNLGFDFLTNLYNPNVVQLRGGGESVVTKLKQLCLF
jgi:hypothetical protein